MNNEKIIIANWKMKLSLAETLALAENIKTKFQGFSGATVGGCPNYISILEVKEILKGTDIKLGAQDVFWEGAGAYTGEISADMLVEAGFEYASIGQSERRTL